MTQTETVARETTERARGGWGATGAAVLGALAMTSCCILPLLLVSLGVTGVFIGQLTALYAYKWLTFSFAAAALGYGFWKAYRPAATPTCVDGTCTKPMNRRVMRSLLWAAFALILLALAFPTLAPMVLTF
jgi:mercuric ion transport protein